ncbi:MAG TPA: hypothetical protein H9684_09595 [Firmicutes bacterium]|nr:hypothetical protein [Bacillota bacterium]
MRKRAAILACVFAASALMAAVPLGASAAGTDVLETFESYKSSNGLSGIWKPHGTKNGDISINLDTQESAPSRGDGKSKGNYRSMRVDFDLSKNEGWTYFRQNGFEDSYALDTAVRANSDVVFVFWAKADQNMTVMAELDIKDIPFYQKISVTTEWKEYRLNLRDLVPEDNLVDKNGNMTGIYERQQQEAWGSGNQEPYLVGFKFQILASDNGNKNIAGSFWLDSLSFSGDQISERAGDSYGDFMRDKLGDVPDDFTPPATTTTQKTTTTRQQSGGTTTQPVTGGDPTAPADDPTTTVDTGSTTEDMQTGDTTSSTKNSTTGSGRTTDAGGTTSPGDEGSGSSMTWVIVVVVVVVVAALGGGAAFYFLYWKKKH